MSSHTSLSVAACLRQAQGLGLARWDAQILLLHALARRHGTRENPPTRTEIG